MVDSLEPDDRRYSAADVAFVPQVHDIERFQQLLRLGPLEFLFDAQISASLRASKRALEPDQAWLIDLALSSSSKYLKACSLGSEQPTQLLRSLLDDPSSDSLLRSEAHSLLGVYYADDDDLASSLYHFQQALTLYLKLESPEGACVCLERHASALAWASNHQAAQQSLEQALLYADNCLNSLYKHYCLVSVLQGMYLRGDKAEASVKSLQMLEKGLDLPSVILNQLHVLIYSRAVEVSDIPKAEECWQRICDQLVPGQPIDEIGAIARVEHLLLLQQFGQACEYVMQYLQYAPLRGKRSQRRLLGLLANCEQDVRLPEQFQAYFQAILRSFEMENEQLGTLDVRLTCDKRSD